MGQYTPAQLKAAVDAAFADPAQRAIVLKLALAVRAMVELDK